MGSGTRIFAAAVAAAGLVGATTLAAAAATPWGHAYKPPYVEKVSSVVHASPDGAVVQAKYTCWGGNARTHLFIGVKQGPDVNATDHTTSNFAQTFYSTNWNADGPGLSLVCNGTSQSAAFLVEPDPFFDPSAPPLTSGPAFVQFCLFDSSNRGEDDPHGFAFNYSMKKVVLSLN